MTVAATVAPIADIVRSVAGPQIHVAGLIPEGADSHTFEPSPGTIRTLARARVVFAGGLHLEDAILRAARANAHPRTTIVALGDRTLTPDRYEYDFTFPRERGDPNPHLWMDPAFAARWSEIVRDVLTTVDPSHAPAYRANQARFAAALARLDRAITTAVATIPAGQRKLLTYHDSFAYFARHYGFEVIGAVQPSDFSEPSAREIKALVAQIEAEQVPAVFGSEVFPSTVLAQVASEAHAHYVDSLRDDVLPGRPGSKMHTYLGMILDDVRTIVRALGGDASALRGVPTTTAAQ